MTHIGVSNETQLRSLTDAAIHGAWDTLTELRADAAAVMDTQQITDVLVVAAAFNGITRVADATGIPLDPDTARTTFDMRESTGIQRFDYSEKSARYDL